MKKAAVATTTARGAAVSSSSATAVQSVYIASGQQAQTILSGKPMAPHRPCRIPQGAPPWFPGLGILLASGGLLLGLAGEARAGVLFGNCRPTGDGGFSCDTQPTGNTLMDDEAARFGLFDDASPGWNEFNPSEGDDGRFGGNGT